MTTWILIVRLLTASGPIGGTSVSGFPIPGFQSEADCKRSGADVVDKFSRLTADFICIEQEYPMGPTIMVPLSTSTRQATLYPVYRPEKRPCTK
jgi:hypothetical protein